MRPNHTFTYLAGQPIQPNLLSLATYYLPIMGSQALALYSTLIAFDDRGANPHAFSQLLNHLNIGMEELESSFDALMALKLVKLYQVDQGYILALRSPLDGPDFLSHQVLSKLLERKIGDGAVKALQGRLPELAMPIEKSLMQVFGAEGEVGRLTIQKPAADFDLVHFKQLMGRDGLRFKDEDEDSLALFKLAENHQKTWFDLYQLAKASAVGGELSIKRLTNQLKDPQSAGQDFTSAESQLIKWAKARQPLAFLSDIKESRKAQVIDYERNLLKQMAQVGLLDAVINVIILYSLNQTTSANLNEKFALKVANDFSYQGINSAEEAVLALRTWGEQKSRPVKSRPAGERTSNVPEWSKEDYRTEATPEELAELQEFRRQMLGDKEN